MVKKKGINLLQCYLILIEFFIISVLLYIPFFILKENTSITDSALTNLIAYFITHIFLIFYLKKKYKIDNLRFTIKNVKLTKIYTFITILLILIFYLLIYPIIKILENNVVFFEKNSINTLHNGLFYFLNILVFAPLLEEIIFRKIIFSGLNKKYSVFISLINSSLIFAIIHINFVQSFEAFFGGLLIGWIYYKTKSILYPIIAHFINNLFYVIDKTYFSSNVLSVIYSDSVFTNFLVLIFFLISLVLLIKYLNLISNGKESIVSLEIQDFN